MKKTGTIEALNVSPKGFYEGILLSKGRGRIQVNLPKDEALMMAPSFQQGQTITVDVEKEKPHGTPVHEVYRLVRLAGATKNGDGVKSFSGQVKALNFALHGEVNGGILDSGDFLHLKPKGAQAIGIKVGMAVKGHGTTKPMVGGRVVIEARDVNGVEIEHGKAKKKT